MNKIAFKSGLQNIYMHLYRCHEQVTIARTTTKHNNPNNTVNCDLHAQGVILSTSAQKHFGCQVIELN